MRNGKASRVQTAGSGDAVDIQKSIPDVEYLTSADGIDEFRLRSNGLQILYMKQGIVPVATVMVTYRVGSRNEPTGLTGATHFLEHLMFKGTERFNKSAGTSIFETLQGVGAQVNATTWFDRTNYYEMLEVEHLALAMEIESDRMRGALLRNEDVASERTVILNEFDRGENEPQRRLFHQLWSTAFIAHPYRHPTIGWRSDIENVSADDLRAFYDTYYWPNNATVSVIGGVDRLEALRLVVDKFGPISRSPEDIPDVKTREPAQSGQRRFEIRMAGEVGSVICAFRIPDGRHADSDALALLGEVLSGGKTSRFYRALTDKGIAAYANAAAISLRDNGLFFAMASGTPAIGNERIEAELNSELDRVVSDGISQAELDLARQQVRTQVLFGRDNSFSIAAQLNESIATGDWRLYAGFIDRMDSVSIADVQRVAQQYLRPETKIVGQFVPTDRGQA